MFLLLTFLSINLGSPSIETHPFFERADRFLKTYVKSGKVNYKSILREPALLDSLVADIATMDLSNQPASFQKAFYINAYNLLVINGVVKYYPIESPIKVVGFFNKNTHQVAGMRTTLDDLEFRYLFSIDRDLRLHFVLNCGAASCPTLYSEAITPEDVEEQLRFSTQMVMDRDDYVWVDPKTKKVRVSKIFEWYKDMFEADGQSIRNFINYNRFVSVPNDYAIEFMDYDWTLNEY